MHKRFYHNSKQKPFVRYCLDIYRMNSKFGDEFTKKYHVIDKGTIKIVNNILSL